VPEQEEPQWPSADEDSKSRGRERRDSESRQGPAGDERDSGKTAELPTERETATAWMKKPDQAKQPGESQADPHSTSQVPRPQPPKPSWQSATALPGRFVGQNRSTEPEPVRSFAEQPPEPEADKTDEPAPKVEKVEKHEEPEESSESPEKPKEEKAPEPKPQPEAAKPEPPKPEPPKPGPPAPEPKPPEPPKAEPKPPEPEKPAAEQPPEQPEPGPSLWEKPAPEPELRRRPSQEQPRAHEELFTPERSESAERSPWRREQDDKAENLSEFSWLTPTERAGKLQEQEPGGGRTQEHAVPPPQPEIPKPGPGSDPFATVQQPVVPPKPEQPVDREKSEHAEPEQRPGEQRTGPLERPPGSPWLSEALRLGQDAGQEQTPQREQMPQREERGDDTRQAWFGSGAEPRGGEDKRTGQDPWAGHDPRAGLDQWFAQERWSTQAPRPGQQQTGPQQQQPERRQQAQTPPRGLPQPTQQQQGQTRPGQQDQQPGQAQSATQRQPGQQPGQQPAQQQPGQQVRPGSQPGQPQPGQTQPGQPQSGQPQSGQPQSGQPRQFGQWAQAGQPQPGQPQTGQPGQGWTGPMQAGQTQPGQQVQPGQDQRAGQSQQAPWTRPAQRPGQEQHPSQDQRPGQDQRQGLDQWAGQDPRAFQDPRGAQDVRRAQEQWIAEQRRAAPDQRGGYGPETRVGQEGPPDHWRGWDAPEQSPQELTAADLSAVPAAPSRIEPEPAERPAKKPKPRKKKRGLLVTGSLVLVLVIAAGVTLALPAVANPLGLPWAPNAPRSSPPEPAAVTRVLHSPDAATPTPTPGGVAAALAPVASDPRLGGLSGSVLDPATGSVLWQKDPGKPLTPASTTKLLTVSAALLTVDHGKQISTKVVQGSDPGTVILVGGGDPTLSSLPDGKDSVYPGAAHLDDLVAQVKQASGGAVKKVQLDLSAYKGAGTAPGWDPKDAGSTYGAQITPAMLDGGRMNPADDHSQRTPDPAGALAQQFAQRLGATVAPQQTTTAPQDAKVLGEVKSAPLTELVSQLLENSDNTLADAVARQTAMAAGAEPSFAGAAKVTKDILAQNGFDMSQVQLSDNSGLSTLNQVPANVLSSLVAAAAAPDGKDPRTPKLRPLLEGLPVAGGSGTLAGRYTDPTSSEGKGWLRAKTGTLSKVNTLAGLVLDNDGRVLVFALMSSGTDQDPARAALDAVAAKLRSCGCY
jgi:D-alanyl-D-alanine carboxypeptidase/D-alanyl-D-alanine-endopeptidase (penicillin-binding protein 4)